MSKKILSLFLVILIFSTLSAGCTAKGPTGNTDTPISSKEPSIDKPEDDTSETESNFNETGYPITKEKSTFTILAATGVTDIENTPMMVEISKETNVYPEWQVIATSAVEERKALMWASDTYPDVIGPRILNKNDVNTYGPQGILIPLNEYFDKYMTWMNELAPDSIWGEMTCFDGNIYYIPTVYDTERYERQYMMNVEWLKKLNLDIPKNIEEFYDCLVAIKEGDPNGNGETDEIPFAIGHVWGDVFSTMPSFFCFFGRPGTYYIDDDGKVVDGRLYDEHKEGIKFLQKCYNEGLMDVELFTQDTAAFRAKGASVPPKYGFMLGYSYSYYVGAENTSQYEPMPLLADSKGKVSYIFGNSNPNATSTSMAITTACKNPEVVMRWANYMHTPEISMQIDYAPIGIGYDYDKDGNLYRIDDAPEGFDSMTSWRATYNEQQFPRLQNSIVEEYLFENFGYVNELSESSMKSAKAVEMYLPYAVQDLPQVSPTDEETEELNMYITDLEKYYTETVATWITSKADIDAEWDKYIEDMNAFNAQKIISIRQQQVDRYYSNLK